MDQKLLQHRANQTMKITKGKMQQNTDGLSHSPTLFSISFTVKVFGGTTRSRPSLTFTRMGSVKPFSFKYSTVASHPFREITCNSLALKITHKDVKSFEFLTRT